VATINRLARFLPTPPPQNTSPEMREWLREEFERLTLASNGALDAVDALKAIPRMYLAGDVDDFLLSTVEVQLVNYSQGGALGEVPTDPSLLLGTITLPLTGAYRLTAYASGLQGNMTQNASIFLAIGVNGITTVIDSVDVNSVQTDVRTLAVTLTRSLVQDDVITMWMSATADLGIFAVNAVSLELVMVAAPDEIQSAQFLIDMRWFP
jgi:hypothetical protein